MVKNSIVAKNKRRFYTSQGIRKILLKRGYGFNRKNISICNVKGGVGKTTIAVNVAKRAANLGFKTLLIDCDKQGNATSQIWPLSCESNFFCLYDIVKNKVDASDSIIKINDFLHIIPSNLKNQLLELEVTSSNINKGTFFKRVFDKLDYDLVLFDTEPNLSQVNLMALAYADLNIAPVRLDKNSIDGLELLLNFIEQQSSEWPEMNVKTKALINGYDKRTSAEGLKKIGIIQSMGVAAFQVAIRIDQNFVHSQDSSTLKRKSKAYEDIGFFTLELLEVGLEVEAHH